MGWLKNKALNWASGVHKREIDDFIRRLAAMDSEELGLPVAIATTIRHDFIKTIGRDLTVKVPIFR